MNKTTEQKLQGILAELLGTDITTLKPETLFKEDLGADSLDGVELVMAIEEEFGIDLLDVSDSDFEKVKTYGEALAFLNARIGDK